MSALDQLIARDAALGQGGSAPSSLDALIARDTQMPGSAATPTKAPVTPAAAPISGWQRFGQGLLDPLNAGAQLATHALPDGAVDAVNRATKWVNDQPVIGPVTKALGMVPATSGQIDAAITNQESQYDAGRKAAGQDGVDWLRMGGNVVSPVSIGTMMLAPGAGAAAGVGRLAATGAGAGAVGGLLQPVTQGADTRFAGEKVGQALVGGLTGGVATPVISKVVAPLVSKVAGAVNNLIGGGGGSEIAGAQAAAKTDELIDKALQESGQSLADVPSAQLASLRSTVANALKTGKQIDPAALARQADFNAVGIPPTLGQITRNPTQFAAERNLRGIEGVGEPLLERFNTQNQTLQQKVAGFGGNQALESYPAGSMISDSLANADETLRKGVTAAYQAARASSGVADTVPLAGIAQDYASILNNYAEKVPGGVRNAFNQYGLLNGTQRKVFSVGDAENLLKVINANRSNDPATNSALGELATSVRNAILSADDKGGVFAGPRAFAAHRFALQDAVPALKAAANGTVAPDDFVKRFILNGKTEQVQGLAKLLDPNSLAQARAQIGAKLQDAAFGQNTAGDRIFSPERYAKAINDLGTDKLSAFFSPAEIAQMKAIGRVGAYINSTPSAAAVNTSNTSSALLSALGHGVLGLLHVFPGGGLAAGAATKGVQGVANARAVGEALLAQVPQTAAPMNPAQAALLGRLLSGGSLAAGVAAAPR